jgi:hypothetical protein
MSATQVFTGVLVVQNCINCGTAFGVDREFDNQRREDHKNFHCPNGHAQHYSGRTEAQKLQDALDLEKRLRGYAEARTTALRDQLGAAERSVRGQKAAKTRLKNRIAAGVCPCCNRSFENVARHMEGQHPEFAGGDSA